MRFQAMVFFSLVLSLVAATGPARMPAADGPEAILARMDRAATAFRSMSSDMHRVHHLAVLNDDDIDTGTIFLKRSKPREMKMLVELTQPDQKSLALQGRKLEIYYPKIQTVQEFDLGKNRELLDQFFLVGFGTSRRDLENAYSIHWLGPEVVAGQKTTRLELIPKSKEVFEHLRKFELWVSDVTGYPAQQKFFLPGGEYMLVTYANVKINAELPDSAFRLHLPKGVKREYPQK